MMQWNSKNTEICFDKQTKGITVKSLAGCWKTDATYRPWIEFVCDGKTVCNYLDEAESVTVSTVKTGTGEGVRVRYSGFAADSQFAIDTIWWLETQTEFLYAWVAPVQESVHPVEKIAWPAPFEFKEPEAENITVYPLMQGVLIPNGWDQEFDLEDHWELEANQVYTRAAYMPWWGQIRGKQGYMAIAQTPWDAAFHLEHPAKGSTSVSLRWNSSLGKLAYGRCVRFEFLEDCTYVTLCKHYREWIQQIGRLRTL